MSDQHHQQNSNESCNNSETWDIVHTDLLSENIGGLYLQSECSDLTLLVENVSFPVHKVILASRSDYFRALLYGGLRESQNNLREIELKDTNAEGFKHLLKYIYTGCISLKELKEETILEILSLANQYHFTRLQTSISDHLKVILTTVNVCCIFDTALMFSLDPLVVTCCSFMDRNASEVLLSEGFLNLSLVSLETLLLRDSFCAAEVDIFRAVQAWACQNNVAHNFNNNIIQTNIIQTNINISNGKSNNNIISSSSNNNNNNSSSSSSSSNNNNNNNNSSSSSSNNNNLDGGNEDNTSLNTTCNNNNNINNNNNNIKITNLHNNNNDMDVTVSITPTTKMNNTISILTDINSTPNINNNDNNNKYKNPLIQLIRLSLMSLDELLTVVWPSKFISSDDILDAIRTQRACKNTDLPFRGFMFPMENVASTRHQARVIEGDMKTSLLDNSNLTYNLDQGYTTHQIEDSGTLATQHSKGITIELGYPCIINHIVMLLWDRDTRSYSYYIETSMDNKEWLMVLDRRKHLCRSKQHLRFKQQVAKYIRVVGTHNSVNRIFHLVSFECYYDPHPCKLLDGLIVPSTNMATIDNAAWVIEGVSRSRNALINGNMTDYDWDSGYTCHQLGSGAIIVQLAQPYVVSSMRLLLWDCDSRSYSYYIEVSNDQQSWTRVVDKTHVSCRSWQYAFFKEQVVTFIKIVGTQNTANEVFHCVHFECPVEESALFEYKFQQLQQQLATTPTLMSASSSSSTTTLTSSSSSAMTAATIQQQLQLPTAASTSRLQGLPHEDNMAVDHGDGYGVGFLGGGGCMPGNS